LVVILALLCGAACAAIRPTVHREAPPLRVGTSGDYPPFSLRAADGSYAGFDIEAASAVQADTSPGNTPTPAGDLPGLATLRMGIDGLDAALVRALVTARDNAAGDAARVDQPALSTALQADAELPGFDEAHADAIATALAVVLRAPR
jgi:ABC-type amino acid transport substrate-binding protein